MLAMSHNFWDLNGQRLVCLSSYTQYHSQTTACSIFLVLIILTVYQISVSKAAGFLVLFYATETEENPIPFLNYNSPQPGS